MYVDDELVLGVLTGLFQVVDDLLDLGLVHLQIHSPLLEPLQRLGGGGEVLLFAALLQIRGRLRRLGQLTVGRVPSPVQKIDPEVPSLSLRVDVPRTVPERPVLKKKSVALLDPLLLFLGLLLLKILKHPQQLVLLHALVPGAGFVGEVFLGHLVGAVQVLLVQLTVLPKAFQALFVDPKFFQEFLLLLRRQFLDLPQKVLLLLKLFFQNVVPVVQVEVLVVAELFFLEILLVVLGQPPGLLLLVLVEVLGVTGAFELGDKGGLHAVDVLPLDPLEEGVGDDLVDPVDA